MRSLSHDNTDVAEYGRYIEDDPYADNVVEWLNEVSDRHGLLEDSDDDNLQRNKALRFCLRFVQSIDYHPDRGGEYPRYPSEMVMDGWGDCEDSAILLALLVRMLDYDCAFLRFHEDGFLGIGAFGHVDLGIAPSFPGEFSGTFWTGDDGAKYFFAHCNGYGFDIGDEPRSKYRRAGVYPVQVSV